MHPLSLFSNNNQFILKFNFTISFISLLFPHHLSSLNLCQFPFLPPVLLPKPQVLAHKSDVLLAAYPIFFLYSHWKYTSFLFAFKFYSYSLIFLLRFYHTFHRVVVKTAFKQSNYKSII